jgi:hypothetical protein
MGDTGSGSGGGGPYSPNDARGGMNKLLVGVIWGLAVALLGLLTLATATLLAGWLRPALLAWLAPRRSGDGGGREGGHEGVGTAAGPLREGLRGGPPTSSGAVGWRDWGTEGGCDCAANEGGCPARRPHERAGGGWPMAHT